MPAETNGTTGGGNPEPDFAQAFQDLARGERTAAALENHLDALERKIEELLAKGDADEKKLKEQANEQPSGDSSSSNASNEKSSGST
jgi:Skp family chaperone for outer membrane proteins